MELFAPLIVLVLTELAKALMRYFRLEPPAKAPPAIAVAAGIGVMQLPVLHSLHGIGDWGWSMLGVLVGFAATGVHQIGRLWLGTTSKRRRRATDRR